MLLTLDLNKELLLTAPRGGSVPIYVEKWGLPRVLRLECWRGKNRATLTAPVITFMVKDDLEDGDALVIVDEWEADENGYTAVLDFNTEPFQAAIAGTKKLDAVCEIQIEAEEGDFMSQTVPLVILRPVITGEDGTPLAMPNADAWTNARAVLHDRAQSLSDAAQLRALANLGITFPGDDVMQIVRNGRTLTIRLSSTD